MNKVYFVVHDLEMHERQSDGVELCIIPEFYNEKIYFYCSEYQIFWDDIEKIGLGDQCCNFQLKGSIRPASLTEICRAGLSNYVKTVKEYCINSDGSFQAKYIHLNQSD